MTRSLTTIMRSFKVTGDRRTKKQKEPEAASMAGAESPGMSRFEI